ncbi:MAG: RNA polymerase sigma factor [Planctomycetes bacterium]|nr:RNA polymerase sigma factor [Planctomycetota bacterium]
MAAMPRNMPGDKENPDSVSGAGGAQPGVPKGAGLTAVPGLDVTKLTDEELMTRALESENFFHELVLRYERPIYVLAYSMLRSPHDAEEVVQDAFLAVYKNARVFNPRLPFTSWLYTIASNLAKNVLRRRKRRWFSLDHEALPEPKDTRETAPSKIWENQWMHETMAAAIASLKPKYGVVLMLRYAEGYSYEEIGEQLGLSLSAVDTRLYRAKKLLRKKLLGLGMDQEMKD